MVIERSMWAKPGALMPREPSHVYGGHARNSWLLSIGVSLLCARRAQVVGANPDPKTWKLEQLKELSKYCRSSELKDQLNLSGNARLFTCERDLGIRKWDLTWTVNCNSTMISTQHGHVLLILTCLSLEYFEVHYDCETHQNWPRFGSIWVAYLTYVSCGETAVEIRNNRKIEVRTSRCLLTYDSPETRTTQVRMLLGKQ